MRVSGPASSSRGAMRRRVTLPTAPVRTLALKGHSPIPRRQSRVVLSERATGNPLASNFALDTAGPIPELRENTCLVKNEFVSVDPAMKGWISSAVNYASVPTDGTMFAFGVGKVVATALPGVEVGDIVTGRTGWQEYGIADPLEPMFRKVEGVPDGHPLSCKSTRSPNHNFDIQRAPDRLRVVAAVLGVLGINGLTAYFGLHKLGRPEPGQTVLVSTAAGAVGSAVGQLAAAAGCRVVGLAGGPAKASLCTTEFGYSSCIDYKAHADDASLEAALTEACPDGVDVFYDMVGGLTLDTVLPLLNVGGRVAIVGTAATAAWIPPPLGPRLERTVLVKRCALQGFLVRPLRPNFTSDLP